MAGADKGSQGTPLGPNTPHEGGSKRRPIEISDNDETEEIKMEISSDVAAAEGSQSGKGIENTVTNEETPKSVIDAYTTPKSVRQRASACKELFHSPGIDVRPVKKPKVDFTNRYRQLNVFRLGNSSQALSPVLKSSECEKKIKTVLPKRARMRFRITPEMNLSEGEQKLAYYVFGTYLPDSDILLQCYGISVTRKEFQCMLPGNEIPKEIILLMCWNNTVRQLKSDEIRTWTFPPSFASEFLLRQDIPEIVEKYSETWMPESQVLDYIYIPVFENETHWYLVVFSFFDNQVCLLDTCRTPGMENHRRTNIRLLQHCMSKIVPAGTGTHRGLEKSADIKNWPVYEVSGIPDYGNSMLSALYLLEWISMEDCFQTQVFGQLDENVARMTATLKLILSNINEVENLEALANDALNQQK